MRGRVVAAATAALLLVAPGCWTDAGGTQHAGEDTGSARCNQVLDDDTSIGHYVVDVHGWHLDCTPPFAPPSSECGWADASSSAGGAVPRTVYVWPGRCGPDDRVLVMIAGHEDGHVVEGPDEQAATYVSWCNWPQQGVGMPGYGPPPGGCGDYPP